MEISATPPAGGKVKEGAAETRLLMVPHDASAALNAELRPAAVRGWHSAAVSDERADHVERCCQLKRPPKRTLL